MRKPANNIRRLFSIARTLARHDALFPLEEAGAPPAALWVLRRFARIETHGRPGERLAAALIELGPSFIKLGQALAVRSDLVGEEIAKDLSTLHDRMPSYPPHQAVAVIEDELDAPIGEIFREFDRTPVAAASIAQVHFAVTADGGEVAVKVLRPGIEDRFASDLELFAWLAWLAESLLPEVRRLRPVDAVGIFAESVAFELDLRFEAASASEFAENAAAEPKFRVPRIDWRRTSRRVLTMERIDGIPINEVGRLREAGLDLHEILAHSAQAFFRQVFEHGFFHADIHPGNMFVGEDGALLPVDFGIMGRLDRKTRFYLADMLLAFLQGDYRRVADVHFDAGYVPRNQSREAFMQACRAIAEPIIGRPMREISVARLLGQLFEVTDRFQMETQPQLLLLQKTMLVAEGVGRRLDPETNMWAEARPLIEEWTVAHRGPQARLREAAGDLLEAAAAVPQFARSVERLSGAVTEAGLRLHPETVARLRERRRGRAWLWIPAVAAAALGGFLLGALL